MQPLPNQRHSLTAAQGLLSQATPILDVRSPGEFDQGRIPGCTNLPILTDDERAKVGASYKHAGPDAAMALGHELVAGDIKQARVQQWISFIEANPTANVMCWRGGQRSAIAQNWLSERGHSVARVEGGYKRLRRACIETLNAASHDEKPWWILAGRTGVHKTALLCNLPNAIDLEGLAHHRGSAFGAHPSPQPAPATFENALACAYLQHHHDTLVLEDESRTIGRLALPGDWHARMQRAPLVLLEADLQTRVANIVAEYVDQAVAAGRSPDELQQHYRAALERISRRLGGVLHRKIDKLMERAFCDNRGHEDWVQSLLRDYYDPMYDYQLRNKQSRIRYQGNMEEVRAYLQQLSTP